MSEKRTLSLVLEIYASWLEANWRIIFGLFSWGAIILIILFTGSLRLSDRIQAISVITLVFITLFYAVQTQALVKEEKRALEEERNMRISEYGEKRITQFLKPLADKLESLKNGLAVITNPRNRPLVEYGNGLLDPLKYVTLTGIESFYKEHDFMANLLLQEQIRIFFGETAASWPTYDNQDDTYTFRWKGETEKAIDKLRSYIGMEITVVSNQIQKTYGYYIKWPLSWDSFYPPAKPPE